MSGSNGLNGNSRRTRIVPAEFEMELRRALAKPEAAMPPALPEERADDVHHGDGGANVRAVFDPESRLLPREWTEFEAVLHALENLPRLETSGAMSFRERRKTEERLLDQLDEWCALIAKKKGTT